MDQEKRDQFISAVQTAKDTLLTSAEYLTEARQLAEEMQETSAQLSQHYNQFAALAEQIRDKAARLNALDERVNKVLLKVQGALETARDVGTDHDAFDSADWWKSGGSDYE